MKRIIVIYLVTYLSWPMGTLYARTLPGSMHQSLVERHVNVLPPEVTALPEIANGDFVRAGQASLTQRDNTLVIDQETAKVLLEWATFDVGSESTVHFKQNPNDVAVNVIEDARPSRIFGKLIADGQIYLLNQNGIIFGEGAQVNVRGMIAAAAKLNGYEDVSSLSEDQKLKFLQNSLLDVIGEGKSLLVVDDEAIRAMGEENLPRIVVEAGASIHSEDAPVVLAGPEVENYGDILATNSQVVLAGSRKDFYLAVSDQDYDLRGYLVEVNSGSGEERGKVTNAGSIVSTLGNVTLVASDIIQAGEIKATTAVDVNGSIYIMARDQAQEVGDFQTLARNSAYWSAANFDVAREQSSLKQDGISSSTGLTLDPPADQQTNQRPSYGKAFIGREGGSVTFAPGSVTEVAIQNLDHTKVEPLLQKHNLDPVAFFKQSEAKQIAQLKSLEKNAGREFVTAKNVKYATNQSVQRDSRIHVAGKTIDVQSDSVIQAKGAKITEISGTGEWVNSGSLITLVAKEDPMPGNNVREVDSEASITIGENALIDASGTEDTVLGAERNVVTMFVTSSEVKDNPSQKGGELLRKTVAVDIRKGTELFDWTPALDTVQKTASERSAGGGRVVISSTGAVDMKTGATVDVSGGKVTYQAGLVETSKVIANGRLLDIGEAPANATIDDVIDLQRDSATDAKWGERDSHNPGTILMSSQNYFPTYEEGHDAGSIHIVANKQTFAADVNLKAQDYMGLYQKNDFGAKGGSVHIDLAALGGTQNVYIQDGLELLEDDLEALYLNTDTIAGSGAETFKVSGSRVLTVQDDAKLELGRQQGLNLVANNIQVQGGIRSLGGDVTLDAADWVDVYGTIDVSGNWVNRKLDPLALSSVASVLDAGDIEINAGESLVIHDAALLRANAGARLDARGKLTVGEAGAVAMALTDDGRPGAGNSPERPAFALLGQVEALDNQEGGSLSFMASDIRIGGEQATRILDSGGADPQTVVIGNDWFAQARVGHFEFIAKEGDITVAEDANIQLQQRGVRTDMTTASTANSDSLFAALEEYDVPDYEARGGSLTLQAGKTDPVSGKGSIVVEQGARIQGLYESELSLMADESILFDGQLTMKGGAFNATLDQYDESDLPTLRNSIYIGNNAVVDLSAAQVSQPGARANVTSDIVEAGSMTLASNLGYVLVDQDATLKLQGGVFKGHEDIQGQTVALSRSVAAGDFRLKADGGFVMAADVDFGAAGAGYRGGRLEFDLSSGRGYSSAERPLLHSIVLGADQSAETAGAFTLLDGVTLDSFLNNGAELADLGNQTRNLGFIASANLDQGHVRSTTLNTDRYIISNNINRSAQGNVRLVNDVNIKTAESLILDTAALDLGDHRLGLESAYVQLGDSDNRSLTADPALAPVSQAGNGLGELSVKADLVDVHGDFILSGDGHTSLTAERGVRLRSVLLNSASIDTLDGLFDESLLHTNGVLDIAAPVIWTESYANGTLHSDSVINLSHYGKNNDSILSVGSRLNIVGDAVKVDTKVAASFGEVAVEATGNPGAETAAHADYELQSGDLVLGEHALLAVASSENVPMGRIKAGGVEWELLFNYQNPTEINTAETSPISKVINLKGNRVLADAGSTLDVSAGGSVYGREFEAGLEGSSDILADAHYSDLFAIVPTMNSGYASYDPLEFRGSGLSQEWGTQFQINGSSQIADGTYTVLPASYALVPGAYLVRPDVNKLVQQGYASVNRNGIEAVSGRLVQNGGVGQTLWSSFLVEPDSAVLNYGTYNFTQLDDFFAGVDLAPGRRAGENGGVGIDVTQQLDLKATVRGARDSAVATYLDITSPGDIVVSDNAVSDNLAGDVLDGVLQLSATLFEDIGAGSVLLGANRTWENGQWTIDAQRNLSNSVRIEDSVAGQEILLVANDSVQVEQGAEVNATGAAAYRGNQWDVSQAGVALLASNSSASRLSLDQLENMSGTLLMGADSRVQTTGTLGVAHSGNGVLADSLDAGAGRLQVFANQLAVGDSQTAEVNLDAGILGSSRDLELYSGGGLAFTHDVNLELASLLLSSNSVYVAAGRQVALRAEQQVTLQSGPGSAAMTPVVADASLLISAARINLMGANPDNDGAAPTAVESRTIRLNAEQVTLQGHEQVDMMGNLNLQAGSAAGGLHIDTPLLGSSVAGSKLNLSSPGALTLLNSSGAEVTTEQRQAMAPGHILALQGRSVTLDTTLANRSGYTEFTATEGDLEFGAGARIDASAYQQTFLGEQVSGPAGIISLLANQDIRIADAGAFDFGNTGQNADGGMIELIAGNQLDLGAVDNLRLGDGGVDLRIQADHFAQSSGGNDGGAGEMDAIAALNQAGANGDLDVMLTGAGQNLQLVAGAHDLTAQSVNLAAARGELHLDAALLATDARRQSGLFGQNGVFVGDNASLEVRTTDDSGQAFKLHSGTGPVQVNADARMALATGLELVTAVQNAAATQVDVSNNDRIGGNGITLYGVSEFSRSTVSSLDQEIQSSLDAIAGLSTEDFVSVQAGAAAVAVDLRPQMDIHSDADLAIGQAGQVLDLAAFRTDDGGSGRVSFRATGDITVQGGVSDGVRGLVASLSPAGISFSYADSLNQAGAIPVLTVEDSSSLQLTAGAVAGSALDRAQRLSAADITLRTGSFLRTGTGNINLQASGDFIQEGTAYVATLGRGLGLDEQGLPAWGDRPYLDGITPGSAPSLWLLYGKYGGMGMDGGDIEFDIAGDVIGNSANVTTADYMIRYNTRDDASVLGIDYGGITSWYAALGDIGSGINAIGGGNIRGTVGGAIEQGGFATPSQGVWYGDAANNGGESLREIAGGSIEVSARDGIHGGYYHVDNGALDVVSRGDVSDSLIIASDASVAVTAVRDLNFSGMVNTFMVPGDLSLYAQPFVPPDAIDSLSSFYFDGYDSTSLHLTSVAGDVNLQADMEAGGAFSQHFSRFANRYAQLQPAYYVLPSEVTAAALSGSINIDERDIPLASGSLTLSTNVLTLFPAVSSHINLYALQDIQARSTAANVFESLEIYLPDYLAQDLPNRDNPVNALRNQNTVAGILVPYGMNSDNLQFNHSTSLIQRDNSVASHIVALQGDVGSTDEAIMFRLPHQVNAYAGGDMVNASFVLQHNNDNDLSTLVADGSIRFTLDNRGNNLETTGGTQVIQVGGPGDLLIQAGGDIELGASRGILSIGNEENRNLSTNGTSVHVYAGTGNTIYSDTYNQHGYDTLVGGAVDSNRNIALFNQLLGSQNLENASFIDLAYRLLRSGGDDLDAGLYKTFADVLSSATGNRYGAGQSQANLNAMLRDYSALETSLQQRLAVNYVKQVVMKNPDQLLAGAGGLFTVPEIGDAGLQTGAQRSEVFQAYFDRVGSFIALDYLQGANRTPDFLATNGNLSLEQIAQLPASAQLQLAVSSYQQLDHARQLLVAESIMLQHNAASAEEGAAAGSAVANFERGYVAQRMFFGSDYDLALRGMTLKSSLIGIGQNQPGTLRRMITLLEDYRRGLLDRETLDQQLNRISQLDFSGLDDQQVSNLMLGTEQIEDFNLGGPGSSTVASLNALLQSWQQDSGVSFAYPAAVTSGGNIDMRFSTIQTRSGGDIALFTPAGSTDVGVSQSLVDALGFDKSNGELGVFSLAKGNIGAVVADAFNVNESRVIPAAGGDINLWSVFGDIDAGRGAKTAVAAPATTFDVNRETGAVTFIVPPTVAGSGIQTRASRASTSSELTNTERYFTIAEGVGSIALATPLGIVDAGEAGIQSAGDLFLGAAKVSGADNISVGGISTGVPTSTSISSDVGGLGSAVDAATNAIQESAEKAAAAQAAQSTAFVTIELL